VRALLSHLARKSTETRIDGEVFSDARWPEIRDRPGPYEPEDGLQEHPELSVE